MLGTRRRSEPPPWSPTGARSTRLSRRLLVLGAAAAGVATAGLTAGRFVPVESEPAATGSAGGAERAGPSFAAADDATPASAEVPAQATPAPTPTRAVRARFSLPDDMVLVTSPRLPLFGVGADDPGRLLSGDVADWRAVGAAVSLPVEPVALAGLVPTGVAPVATYADYEALVVGLAERPGGLAAVPLTAIDFRVNLLSVAGVDPLDRWRDDAQPTIHIAVVGDIVPGRNVHAHMERYGDFTRPFQKVAAHLRSFDLTIANLEGNLSDSLPQPVDPHSFSFISRPAMIDGFKLAGIDAVSLANNHAVWNSEGWGLQGLLDTIAALDAAGLPYFGAGTDLDRARAPWRSEVRGTTVAILGIDGVTANYEVEPGVANGVLDFDAGATADRPGTNPYASSFFLQDIAAATSQADVVIPYFHFGAEYVAVPPRWAVNGARAAIDAGATMVVTNHPHVIQGMEVYNGRPIVYSPGNFILDQMWSVEVRSGLILDITVRAGTVVRLRCHGVEIEEFHQPRPMTAGEQANLMDRFWASTDRLATRDG